MKMNKHDMTKKIISFMLFIFYCSELVLTLGHHQAKKFFWKKV